MLKYLINPILGIEPARSALSNTSRRFPRFRNVGVRDLEKRTIKKNLGLMSFVSSPVLNIRRGRVYVQGKGFDVTYFRKGNLLDVYA